MSATALIEALDRLRLAENPDRSLSSALRTCITRYFYGQSERYGFYDPDSRWALRISRPSKSEMAEDPARAMTVQNWIGTELEPTPADRRCRSGPGLRHSPA
jgi:hypothetical protein